MDNSNPYSDDDRLDPTTVAAVLGLQQQKPQQAAITRRRQMADQTRAGLNDQMRGRMVGNVYVPPNAANLTANIFGQYRLKQMGDDLDTREGNLGVQQTDAMRRFYDALTGRKLKQQMPYMGEEGE